LVKLRLIPFIDQFDIWRAPQVFHLTHLLFNGIDSLR
jgi:hypothetical protein